jgi:HPt (histidine-containing phosphotransfer) domain-containing protein
MGHKKLIELFMPPNMLKAKVGGGQGGSDMAAMKRALLAVEALQGEFAGWLAADVKTLTGARTRYNHAPDDDSRAALHRAAHDIKGQAPTFSYPLIARVAASLSRLIGELPREAAVPAALVDAHVDAILAIHKRTLQDANDKTAQALCAELDTQVDDVLKTKT